MDLYKVSRGIIIAGEIVDSCYKVRMEARLVPYPVKMIKLRKAVCQVYSCQAVLYALLVESQLSNYSVTLHYKTCSVQDHLT